MFLDRLSYRRDPLAGFDGRCRLLSAALLISAALSAPEPAVPGALLAAALLLQALRPGNLLTTLRRLVPVNMMSAALWLPVLAGFSPAEALLYTLRINCAAALYMAFAAPLGISALSAAMTWFRTPPKLVSLFILSYRYIFLLYDSFNTALTSMRLRQAEQGTVYRWRALSAVFASALTRAALRAEEAGMAMSGRGFDGAFPVTLRFAWKFRDSLLITGSAALSVSLVIFSLGRP
ncbi:MAG: energy-coupling factor transporter transmembrane protein EcfT [Spirochaetaceae bacterium]|jgi:cobalt/nickel transport system permease protein|nr:energy-coupling factor transporter transmembrane protein EcfT [Spirochaetaceae bacterium]